MESLRSDTRRHPEVVRYDDATWVSTHRFKDFWGGPACWCADDGRWAFDLDELGWAGLRGPNMGVYASFGALMNGVAAQFAETWDLGVPMHVAWTPGREGPLERAAAIIERSLAVTETREAIRVFHSVRDRRDGCVDSVTVHVRDDDDSDADGTGLTILAVTVTYVRYEDGVLVEEHEDVFRRTDASAVAERTAGFWGAAREEFVARTWHPSRVLSWCLALDDLADLADLGGS